MPEASSKELYNADLGGIAKRLKLKFIPPALKRRSDETGLPPEDYVMEAFYKAKLYDLVYRAYLEHKLGFLLEIDFVLKALTAANNILHEHASETPDWEKYDGEMVSAFEKLLGRELADWEETAIKTGTKKAPAQNQGGRAAQAPAKRSSPTLGQKQPPAAIEDSSPNKKSRVKKPSEIIDPPADFSMDDSQWAAQEEE
jgi:hypothetical protein